MYQYDIWYMSLYVGDRLVCRFGWSSIQTCTLDGHLHRVTCTRYRINTIDPPSMYEKRIVCQVGYLQEFVGKELGLYAA